MATREVIVDQPPANYAPVDPNVLIPDHVRKAAELAESFYKKPEETPEPAAEVQSEPAAEVAPEVAPEPPAPAAEVAPEPPRQPEHHQENEDGVSAPEWKNRYLSMKGRWEASQRTIGSMQEQMSQLGDELMRTQALLRDAPQQQVRPTGQKFITPEDEQAYDPELIDVMRRAAAETLGPEIEQLRSENQTLKQRVTQTAQGEVRQLLDNRVPNWRDVNKSPEFKRWLSLRNIYTGEVRQNMLNTAYAAADAPKVVEFFKDFLREGIATGQVTPATPPEQPPAPRQAAVPLETLAAPGRARPASGESPASPADKPIYTRAQIATFYNQVRQGTYAGRETEKARLEQSIFAAQAEGRVR